MKSLIILIIVIGLIYHLLFGYHNAWIDGDAYFHYSFIRESLADGDLIYSLSNPSCVSCNEPILFYLPTIGLSYVVGLPLAFMLMPPIYYVIIMVIAYYLLKDYVGDKAWLPLLLLSFSVSFAYRASPTTFRSDLMIMPLLLLSIYYCNKGHKHYFIALIISLASSLFSNLWPLIVLLTIGYIIISVIKPNNILLIIGSLILSWLLANYICSLYPSLMINELLPAPNSTINLMTNGLMPLCLIGLLLIKDKGLLFISSLLCFSSLLVGRLLFISSPFTCLLFALIIDYLSKIVDDNNYGKIVTFLLVGLFIMASIDGLLTIEPSFTNCEVEFMATLTSRVGYDGTFYSPWELGGVIQYYTGHSTITDSVNGQDIGLINEYNNLLLYGNSSMAFDYLVVYNSKSSNITYQLLYNNDCLSLFKKYYR